MSVQKLTFVTGHAGTGKTTQLMELAGDLSESLITRPTIQFLLAVTHMHGARRRIDALLRKEHPNLPVRITTIHSFSLDIVNRWRRALGYNLPIVVDPDKGGLGVRYGAHHASFSEVLSMTLTLLDTASVRGFIATTYPLIVVDEFQECDADAIALIEKLTGISQVILAADGFQDLTTADNALCGALVWLESCKSNGATHIELSKQHRTNISNILHTAHCLRQNVPASSATIDKYVAPTVPMLAWKVVQAFLNKELVGTCAIICPTADPQLEALLTSINNQLAKKGVTRGIRWTRIQSSDQEKKSLCTELGISHTAHTPKIWSMKASDILKLQPRAASIHAKVIRFGKLSGRKEIYSDLVSQFAQAGLHADRSYSPLTGRFEVTTVHGAKNREFDHVFIFWGYRLPPGEKHRKLLYNAVTRAKRKCVLLVQQSKPALVQADPVLSILGQYQSPFGNAKKKSSNKKTAKKTSH